MLGEDFDGVLCVDGRAPCRGFEHAEIQTCLAHLLRRSKELREAHRRPRALHTSLTSPPCCRRHSRFETAGTKGDHEPRIAHRKREDRNEDGSAPRRA